MGLRETIAFYFEDIETPIGRAIDLTIAGLVLFSSAIFVAETYPLNNSVRLILDTLDNLILGIFAFEYLIRFWCAKNKINHFLNLYSFIDLVAILPFFITPINISFIRLFRWFRILRLIRFLEGNNYIRLHQQ